MCPKCGLKGHFSWHCHEMLQRKELDLDEENNEVSEVTDVVPMPASGGVIPAQQVPQVAPVLAPRHRVLHQSPGPAPVPAPRQVRDVVTLGKDHGQDNKDEEKLKMSQ